jgi:hypothetical protein
VSTLARSAWAPLLAAAGTWWSLKRKRSDEHAQWQRGQLIELGAEVIELAVQKWDRVHAFKRSIHCGDSAQRQIALKALEPLMAGWSGEATRLRFLSAKAKVLGENRLSDLISDLFGSGVIPDPAQDQPPSVFDEKSTELTKVRLLLVEELTRILKET